MCSSFGPMLQLLIRALVWTHDFPSAYSCLLPLCALCVALVFLTSALCFTNLVPESRKLEPRLLWDKRKKK